jgi:hypothetical protein
MVFDAVDGLIEPLDDRHIVGHQLVGQELQGRSTHLLAG